MPWREPEYPGDFPTLGYAVAEFIQDSCAIPDGDHRGEPFMLTDEMLWFLLWYYRIDPETERWYFERGGQLVRPQKWGKGPFSAAWVCAEAEGPTLFDGWDSRGEPVGRPWATPWIQVTAVSEDQTDNVWRALVPMIELGSLNADIPDTGETRINLRGGGRIEPVTSSARSRLGQRVTAAVQDETHSWLAINGGRKLADNQRRNLAGMGGRFLETTNAWDPTESSVAQMTAAAPAGVHVDFPQPPPGSVRNKRERRKVMKVAYGNSWWVDLDRIDLEVEALLEHDPAQAERFFLNRIHAGESLAFDAVRWSELTDAARVVADRSLITVGVAGGRYVDALALIATEVASGHQWPLAVWEQPAGADDDYEHPSTEIDGAMTEALERFDVTRVYVAYDFWLLDNWIGRWDKDRKAADRRFVSFPTNQPTRMAHALRAYRSAQTSGDLSHDGDSTFASHIGNARKRATTVKDDKGKPMWLIQKEAQLEIAGAFAGCLSWEARGDAIAAGVLERKRYRVAGF